MLNTVLNEEAVTADLVRNVALHTQEVGAVDSHGTIPRVVERVAANIRLPHITDHVEVKSVPA